MGTRQPGDAAADDHDMWTAGVGALGWHPPWSQSPDVRWRPGDDLVTLPTGAEPDRGHHRRRAFAGRREPVVPPDVRDDEARGFVAGLQAGWEGLSDAFVLTSTVVGAVLPFGVLVAVLGVPVLVWRRRRVSPQPVAAATGPQ